LKSGLEPASRDLGNPRRIIKTRHPAMSGNERGFGARRSNSELDQPVSGAMAPGGNVDWDFGRKWGIGI
jgi:hypothetical protein